MIDRSKLSNSFEFISVAGARAKQLMKGARPRVTGPEKPTTIAQQEVAAGEVRKVDPKTSESD